MKTNNLPLSGLLIAVMVLGVLSSVAGLAIPVVKAQSNIKVNQQATFEGITFNTTGTLTYNSTAIKGGSLKLKITDGPVIVTTTYTINAQKANGNFVRFLMFAHVNDSSNSEVAAYLYVDVSTATVSTYFGARNADFAQHGTVDFIDYSIMSYHSGYCSGQSQYDPATDLAARGCTDVVDWGIFNIVYGDPAYR
jgi:hypothetical protein